MYCNLRSVFDCAFMVDLLPRWIWISAFILTFISGFINVVSILSHHQQAVSHLTGTISQFGIFAVNTEWSSAIRLLGVVLSFFLGAIVSGIIIRDSVLRRGKRYGIVMMFESFLLIVGLLLMQKEGAYGDFFVSAGCGMQNAMATTFSGAILRTTHMTGVITDFGILVGQWIVGIPFDKIKLRVYLSLLTGFSTGSLVGVSFFQIYSINALWIPISILFCFGFLYYVYRLYMIHTTGITL